MGKKIKNLTFLLWIILSISCATNKEIPNDTVVNTQLNLKYNKSKKAYIGVLNASEYNELIKKLEEELKTIIPTNKSILINFNQKAPNCISARFSEQENTQMTNKRIQLSSQISASHNVVDFFVYAKDSYNKEIYEKTTKFILDSGFFYENIFTEHQNCAGFLIVKPNREFYKYYGEDYYSEIKAFFKKK